MISLKNLSKSFGNVQVINKVTLNFEKPGISVIMGASGCGKTTLLRLIAGLEIPDEGEIYLDAELVTKKDWILPAHYRKIGFVFQVPALWPHMNVAQNILFGMGNLAKKEAQARLKDLLEKTGLSGKGGRYPDQISGGEARRVALARSIAVRPRYLLLDEPLTNLDKDAKEKLLRFIKKEACRYSEYLIYVTHDIQEAKEISENIITMDCGQIK